MIRVLGIDPSVTATGLAVPGGAFRTIKPKKGPDDPAGRRHEIYCALSGIFTQLRRMDAVDVAIVEGVMPGGGGHSSKTTIELARVSAIIQLALYESAIPFADVHLMSLKKYATGNGHAQKQDMLKHAKERGAKVRNDNEADAFFLQTIGDDYYNRTVSEQAFILRKDQLDLLDKIAWPRI